MQDFLIFVSEQWILFSLLTLILILMAITSKPPKNEIKSVDAVKLINQNKVAIYDVRSEEDYRKARLINAKNSKLVDIDFKSIKEDYLLIYGNESIKLTKEVNKRLKNEDVNIQSKVYILSMGLNDWLNEDYPVVSGKQVNNKAKKKEF